VEGAAILHHHDSTSLSIVKPGLQWRLCAYVSTLQQEFARNIAMGRVSSHIGGEWPQLCGTILQLRLSTRTLFPSSFTKGTWCTSFAVRRTSGDKKAWGFAMHMMMTSKYLRSRPAMTPWAHQHKSNHKNVALTYRVRAVL
jgi:hypothetical protein